MVVLNLGSSLEWRKLTVSSILPQQSVPFGIYTLTETTHITSTLIDSQIRLINHYRQSTLPTPSIGHPSFSRPSVARFLRLVPQT